jgi:hypothetical protein
MPDFDNDLPPVLEPAPAPPAPPAPPPATSQLARLLNVFATPGQVFEEVRVSQARTGNWLWPTLLCSVALAFSACVVLSMPSVWKQLATQQEKIRAHESDALAKSVQAGKIEQADADKALKLFDAVTRPVVMKSAAAAGGFLLGIGRVFWWAFVLWLLARAFVRSPVPYGKALEVAGLASMVALLNTVVMLALTVNVGKSFGASGFTLSVVDFNAQGGQALAGIVLSAVNFWLVAVLGFGLARLTGAPGLRGVFLVFGYWVLTELLLLMLGLGTVA